MVKRKRLKFDVEEQSKVMKSDSTVMEVLDTHPETQNEDHNDDDKIENVKIMNSYKNKQRVLILSSRGITARYRHLLEDLKKLIPHHKKDNKLDAKDNIHVINEIAEMKSCNNILYLETRKHQDLYMYLGKSPLGPSAKFHVVNIHTMDELKLTGNCMMGSRPILNFDIQFESKPHWQLLKALLTDIFNTPKGHPKSKPFYDHVLSFFLVNNNICEYHLYFNRRHTFLFMTVS
jgi:ribosome biogenesis protein BRX1